MSLLQQIITLLIEPPGSVIYHLITLLALQTVAAIAWGLWRRVPENSLARRMFWAASFIFVARLAWLIVSLLFDGDLDQTNTWLPLLEQSVHTITAVLLMWVLVPPATRWPRLGNLLAGLAVIVIGVMALFFAQSWQAEAAAGALYDNTTQAIIWNVGQIAILLIGVLLTVTNRRYPPLHTILLVLLLTAHLAHGWSQVWRNEPLFATSSQIPYWIRLGQLIVLPLWSALAYRTSLTPLLANPLVGTEAYLLANVLPAATPVFAEPTLLPTLRRAITYAGQQLPHNFLAIALLDDENQLTVTSNLPQPEADSPRQWQPPLSALGVVQQTITTEATIHLGATGTGARQFHDFHRALGLQPAGALLVEPLRTQQGTVIGALIIAGPATLRKWREPQRTVATAVAGFVAQAIANARAFEHAPAAASQDAVTLLETAASGAGRIVVLESELDAIQIQLDTANARLLQAEAREKMANRRARDLAKTLQEIEQQAESGTELAHLRAENEALRESLVEAEEAMALASAGEGGLSTDWVMLTITRYSGQLEAAQEKIESLETALKKRADGPVDDVVASIIQELRTPMTSIGGFTDLLLSESAGKLGAKQREFLQRVRRNVERLGELLAQIVQLTAVAEQQPVTTAEPVNLQEVTEVAMEQVMSHVRHKGLRIDLLVAPEPPLLTVNRDEVVQILTNLLKNACEVSPVDGHIALAIAAETLSASLGQDEPFQYVSFTIQDSGPGIPGKDRGRVFVPRVRADDPLIPGISDTTANLAMTRALVENNGGRIWVNSQQGQGTAFVIIFPHKIEANSPSENGQQEQAREEKQT